MTIIFGKNTLRLNAFSLYTLLLDLWFKSSERKEKTQYLISMFFLKRYVWNFDCLSTTDIFFYLPSFFLLHHLSHLHKPQHSREVLILHPDWPPIMLWQTLLLSRVEDSDKGSRVPGRRRSLGHRISGSHHVHIAHGVRASRLGEVLFPGGDGKRGESTAATDFLGA